MKITAVADEDTVLGLKLAGVNETYIVNTPLEAESKIRELSTRSDVGLIIITEQLGSKIRKLIQDIIRKGVPIILEIPDKTGALKEAEDPIRELVKKAVGVDIKIGKHR
ncbi:MAG: V-type ATP synthase subunit F [Candidatus Odinarchaeum yellowstonii]|jgi:V/A-type H+-transporting ATPase subunit F|uniref:A-type ATP synthase subunit F n=1 Tax=Odinarchaeota yellowstonii (strain LCB_4) TaxID=1841599 RepID=A0AAF0IC58_ODILC|nr:MAG: V-type ATP synthase subunit F [Candidatus Odinarchaeum yellowstonii]